MLKSVAQWTKMSFLHDQQRIGHSSIRALIKHYYSRLSVTFINMSIKKCLTGKKKEKASLRQGFKIEGSGPVSFFIFTAFSQQKPKTKI